MIKNKSSDPNKQMQSNAKKISDLISANQVAFAVITILYILPLLTDSGSSALRGFITILSRFMIAGVFALSFDLQLGRTGLLNFGQALFFGVGAYVTAWCLAPILPSPLGEIFNLIPFPLTIIVSILAGMIFGLIMGATTNRMKGTAFAFIALAIAMLVLEFMELKENLLISGGESGLSITRPFLLTNWIVYILFAFFSVLLILFFVVLVVRDNKERNSFLFLNFKSRKSALTYTEKEGITPLRTTISWIVGIIVLIVFLLLVLPNILDMFLFAENITFKIPILYWFILSSAIAVYLFVKRLTVSPFGRVLSAIAQNEDRVKALGYNTFYYKILSVTISGGIGALAGSLYTVNYTVISTPETFGIGQAIDAMLYTILGGLGTLLGPFVGAVLIEFSELRMVEFLRAFSIDGQWWLVFLGIIYIFIILFFPYGIVGSLQLRSRSLKVRFREWFNIRETDYWWLTFI
ncbi:MAG: branched-chain amino acid ABC transporter permease, partial [Candidatus Kariarchaeaceae archaeon]